MNYLGFHVIRDPRDIVVSAYFSHKKTHPMGDWLKDHRTKLNRVSLEEGIRLEMDFRAGTFKTMHDWNYNNPRIYETRFEILTVDSLNQYSDIFRFLGFLPKYISNTRVQEIVHRYTFERMSKGRKQGEEDANSHFRKGIHGDWVDYIYGENKQYFKEKYGTLLIDLGYEQDLNW
jgi:hypothetical protein